MSSALSQQFKHASAAAVFQPCLGSGGCRISADVAREGLIIC